MPSIVQISISQTVAAAPNTLQSRGALISQGGTSMASGTYALLTQPSDLTPSASLALASLSWSGGSVLATTAAVIPGLTVGDVFPTTVAGATPAGYNGLVLATVTGASTFTYPLAVSPGTETVAGTYTPPGVGELQSMVTSFFGQGTSTGVYVLELGAGDFNTGPTVLGTFITANPDFFYSYLVPRGWDAKAGFLALMAQFEALSSKVNFFVTTTAGTYSVYTGAMNCALALVEAPGLPLTEFSVATDFQKTLAYAPSSVNRLTPNAFSFLFGVTPFPVQGTNTLLTALKNANINYVGTGAEGGISNTILYWGRCLDGNDFSYRYSVDWIQINAQENVANAVINGSNDSINPLWYDQPGINRLQDVAVQTVADAITFGLATGTVTRTALSPADFLTAFDNGDFAGQNVVNAVPLTTYLKANPGDRKLGKYAGLTVVYIPARGFQQIVFGILVTEFTTP